MPGPNHLSPHGSPSQTSEEPPPLPLPELPRSRLRVHFDDQPADWTVRAVGTEYFAVSGAEWPAGAEAVATFVCADTLTVSMRCVAQPAADDGEQWFAVLNPESEVVALLRRLLV
jgi:hypothetical protein